MDNTDNRTNLPEGRAEQTRRAADETQTQAAAGKQAKTGGMTRRTLCLGIGGAAVMLGLGGLKVANPQAIIRPPGGTGRGSPDQRLHPLREMLRDLPARRHPSGAHRGRHPKHAHTDIRFQRQLLRLVH